MERDRQRMADLERRLAKRSAALQHAERELEELRAQLVHSGNMATIGMLAAGVAHELNSPIASMGSAQDTLARAVARLAEQLAKDGADARIPRFDALLGAITNSSEVIQEAVERVDEIARRLRNFAHLDEADLKRVDVNEGIRDTIALMGRELGNVELEINLARLPKIAVYPGALNEVFLNLLRNARQALGTRGTIWVRTGLNGDRVVLEVRDNGRGIAPDALPTLFEPRFTTRDNRVATGLGLSVCKRVVQQHQGSIRVESELGVGSTFTVELPIDLETRAPI